MTIGEKLKRARKKLNKDLDEVAQETKIAKMFIIAMENDDIASLPGGVYTRNFLRTYAKFLQLDEDIVTAEYHDQYEVKPHFVLQQEQTKLDDLQFKKQRRRYFVIFLSLALVVALVFFILSRPGVMETLLGERRTGPARPGAVVPTTSEQQVPVEEETAAPTRARAETKPEEKVASGEAATEKPESTTRPRVPGPGSDDGGPVSRQEVEDEPRVADESAAELIKEADADLDERTDSFPVTSAAQLKPVNVEPGESPALTDVFGVYAVENVDIEINIDGVLVTRRLLRAGDQRFYKYGRYQSIRIQDAGKARLQLGEQEVDLSSRAGKRLWVLGFEPSEALDAVAAAMAAPVDEE